MRLVSNFEDIMEFVQESQNAELYFQPYLKVIPRKHARKMLHFVAGRDLGSKCQRRALETYTVFCREMLYLILAGLNLLK